MDVTNAHLNRLPCAELNDDETLQQQQQHQHQQTAALTVRSRMLNVSGMFEWVRFLVTNNLAHPHPSINDCANDECIHMFTCANAVPAAMQF